MKHNARHIMRWIIIIWSSCCASTTTARSVSHWYATCGMLPMPTTMSIRMRNISSARLPTCCTYHTASSFAPSCSAEANSESKRTALPVLVVTPVIVIGVRAEVIRWRLFAGLQATGLQVEVTNEGVAITDNILLDIQQVGTQVNHVDRGDAVARQVMLDIVRRPHVVLRPDRHGIARR